MKKLLSILLLLVLCSGAAAQTYYNAIATAYVTTTISQNVVFNSTMQQGGTFTFSVLAHNGGGRAGQSDTANVKIQFYTASNVLVTSINSNYSANLPNPNAVCGNPCIDTTVPWSTLTTNVTLTAAQAATVAYAKVSMYGIDGSYWAGDYGPWYRAPTLQLNGGGNLLYNPEFGPYNGVTAQGWTSSPGFGACQGAWGGSNACIVNSDGVPGSSTVGLVANANGGGPDPNGGTTSGTAGGYNNTMTVTNAGTGATAGAPPAPTVTGTSTTYTTQTTIVGKNQIVTSTPVTTTTYSDGSTTSTTGTSTQSTVSSNNFTGARFGAAQVADTQWNVQACTQTNRCQVYSTLPGGTYQTGSWTPIGATQYITFIPNTGADSATNPWKMILVNNDGTFSSLGTGRILVQGVDANNNIFLFFTNDNYNGTLLSANLGLSGQGADFTGTANPSITDTDTLALGMSSTPLAAGQTGGSGGNIWPATSDITVVQQQQKTAAAGRVSSLSPGNYLYIDQKIGSSNNIVTVEQTGNYNKISGLGGTTYAILDGTSNTLNIKQGDTLGKNLIEFSVTGNTNNVTVWQARNPTTGLQDGSESGGHYLGLNINGSTNTLSLKQSNDGGATSGHFAYVDVTGNNNNGTLKQSGNGEKTFFGIVNGNTNVFDVTQQGSGSYFDLSLTGNGHSVTANQKDAGSHKATINLTNAGGASTVTLVQQGATAQNINITQQCAALSGCSVSVTQGP